MSKQSHIYFCLPCVVLLKVCILHLWVQIWDIDTSCKPRMLFHVYFIFLIFSFFVFRCPTWIPWRMLYRTVSTVFSLSSHFSSNTVYTKAAICLHNISKITKLSLSLSLLLLLLSSYAQIRRYFKLILIHWVGCWTACSSFCCFVYLMCM